MPEFWRQEKSPLQVQCPKVAAIGNRHSHCSRVPVRTFIQAARTRSPTDVLHSMQCPILPFRGRTLPPLACTSYAGATKHRTCSLTIRTRCKPLCASSARYTVFGRSMRVQRSQWTRRSPKADYVSNLFLVNSKLESRIHSKMYFFNHLQMIRMPQRW